MKLFHWKATREILIGAGAALAVAAVFFYKTIVLDDDGLVKLLVISIGPSGVLCCLHSLVRKYSRTTHFIAFLSLVFLVGVVLFELEFCKLEVNEERWPNLCGGDATGLAVLYLIVNLLLFGIVAFFAKRQTAMVSDPDEKKKLEGDK
jgi:Na+/melibiose symporter-like transporter